MTTQQLAEAFEALAKSDLSFAETVARAFQIAQEATR